MTSEILQPSVAGMSVQPLNSRPTPKWSVLAEAEQIADGYDIDQVIANVKAGTSAMEPYPLVGGNKVTFIPTVNAFYDDLRTELSQGDVRAANFSQYAWYRNGFGKEMAAAVRDLALDGVDVASTTDMMGTRSKFGSMQQSRIRRAGGEVAEHRPWSDVDGNRAPADHRKLAIVFRKDRTPVFYLPGAGFGKKYEKGWIDHTVKIEGPAAAWAQAEHLARLRDLGGTISDLQLEILEDGLRNPVAQGTAGVRLLTTRPGQDSTIAEFIDGQFARRDAPLYVSTSFFADPDRAAALARAAEDGREIYVIMTPLSWSRQVRQFFPDAVSRTYVNDMVKAGVHVIEPAEFYHGKGVFVPGEKTYTAGSANMSASNFYELNAAITDAESAAAAIRYHEGHVAGGKPMTTAMFDNAVDGALRTVVNAFKIGL